MPLQYEPLDPSLRQIRLLTLLSPSEGKISAQLHVASLEDQPVFDALSYVWGVEDDPDPICINGETCKVKKNLKAALRRLQDSEPLVIWIDAICIDQENVDEKNHQLPLMRDIYTRASQVIVWLGEGDKYIDAIFQYADEWKTGQRSRDETHSMESREVWGIKAYIGHSAFLMLPYWQRMWTFQELALPESDPICVYGKYRCNLSTIISRDGNNVLTSTLHKDKDILAAELACLDPATYGACGTSEAISRFYHRCNEKVFDGIIGVIIARSQRDLNGTLALFLSITRGRKCSDARDRIYVLYGLAESLERVFPADYSQRNSLEKVLVETTTWMIENCDSWSLFEKFGMHPTRFSENLSLPSWVPDFDSKSFISGGLPQDLKTVKSLRQRSPCDLAPATHDRNVAVLLGLPGVGVVAAGEPEHKAIPASFRQFDEDLRPWAIEWLDKQGVDGPIVMFYGPRKWHVVQLPAYCEPKAPQVAGKIWFKGLADWTQKASNQHLTRYFLGDMPTIRITARNIGICRLMCEFKSDSLVNGLYIGEILWAQKQQSSWNLATQVIDLRRQLYPGAGNMPESVVATMQTAEVHGMAMSYKNMFDFAGNEEEVSQNAATGEYSAGMVLTTFMMDSAESLNGCSAFTVDIHGKTCFGLTKEPVETGDIVIMPLAPLECPLVLRKEVPKGPSLAETSNERSLHGTWDEIVWHRMVGIAIMHDLAEETEMIAKVVNQSVEDFYVR
ncbi:hypothetical protein E8E14_012712 [Neopestalotiopsis sp. 37M]|nr:hypothetical protein E8E14_012712 [Neopestalotiopsis sp. 37M]